jgi:hypothetical protein
MAKLIALVIVLLISALLITDANGCQCNMSSGLGRFCGRTLNRGSSGCTPDDIYQCGGLGTSAESLGPCRNGCYETPAGQNDRCN